MGRGAREKKAQRADDGRRVREDEKEGGGARRLRARRNATHRRRRARALEELAHGTLRFADEFVEQLGAFHGHKVRVALVCDGLREQRLAAPRRPVQQDTCRHPQPELFELLRVPERVQHGELELVAHFAQGADVVPRDVRDRRESFPRRRRKDVRGSKSNCEQDSCEM